MVEWATRGRPAGFPEPALTDDLTRCQRLLREDIVDKVLKRDMTAFYGVRRVLEIERLFLYLCYHDGGILDIPTICGRPLSLTRARGVLQALYLVAKSIRRCPRWPHSHSIVAGGLLDTS